ncbi:N-terminal part of putative portal protein [Shimwellia blattae DSM 4481 = NBRC 105725]|uniref:N-terminal part of putative portal protein n=2 Tax=Shimwellia blattae TaxID=563 RepID=I2B9R9_SHIBC|nr:N-terminal part of putative portal protein [Shimwellia blattae DSM 4481 = NBRC 105725]VDY64764.1 Uncharacterised protein [Shimwellia blattae]VEC22863.1 Uncharacterised protein [Shimwellia blattae]
MAETLEKKHERVMLRFDRAYTPQQDVREKCIEATRFARVPGGQWEGSTAAGTKLDDQFEKYPKFEINKVATELNRIIAEYRNNRICSGQLKLATGLEFFQYRFSDSFGGNPPL